MPSSENPKIHGLMRAKDSPSGELPLHHVKEVFIALCSIHLAQEPLHGLHGIEWIEDLSEQPYLLEDIVGDKEILLSSSRCLDVHRGIDTSLAELSVQHDLHITSSLELLEDNFVHSAAGLDECRSDDGEAAAFLHVTSSAEEALRLVERI